MVLPNEPATRHRVGMTLKLATQETAGFKAAAAAVPQSIGERSTRGLWSGAVAPLESEAAANELPMGWGSGGPSASGAVALTVSSRPLLRCWKLQERSEPPLS